MKATFALVVLFLLCSVPASAQCETLMFVTETLPDFILNQRAHTKIEVTGGDPPYRFEILAGVLPEGVHMTNGGNIRGKTRDGVDNSINVQVTDSDGCSLMKSYDVHITTGP